MTESVAVCLKTHCFANVDLQLISYTVNEKVVNYHL